MPLEKLELLSSSEKHCIQKWHITVKHLKPYFLTTFVQHKYIEVLFGRSGAHKFKYRLKPLLIQNIVLFTYRIKSRKQKESKNVPKHLKLFKNLPKAVKMFQQYAVDSLQ